ncbi:zinc-finger domain-containing protein [Fervidibacillus albus]|uniref:Zinc-finger domain-containing protein n=1 Tax=Fervidibacillus albus TaxID=2980026 RepID=A0A9E8LWQ7_9BACI|nr:zinc-finger domain-containing protein [Fervidibacillus albus]WAA11080.1 zinc-finger domain-containing protein [Fervidibacillus albus]
MRKRKIRRKLLDKIDQTLQTYCHDCLLYQHFKNEKGRPYAHQFCIHSCTVGDQLQAYGRQLNE